MTMLWSADNPFSHALIEKLGLTGKSVRRIVIDCNTEEPVKIYVELHGSEKTLDAKSLDLFNSNDCIVEVLE